MSARLTVLGLDATATPEDGTKRYKLLAVKYHPDKDQDEPATAHQNMCMINAAYEVLQDHFKRKTAEDQEVEELFKSLLRQPAAKPAPTMTPQNSNRGLVPVPDPSSAEVFTSMVFIFNIG